MCVIFKFVINSAIKYFYSISRSIVRSIFMEKQERSKGYEDRNGSIVKESNTVMRGHVSKLEEICLD